MVSGSQEAKRDLDDLNADIHVLKSSVVRHLMWNVALLESMWISFRPTAVERAA